MQRTLILAKPDTVRRKLVGNIISRFENKNLCLQKIKLFEPDEERFLRHYHEDVHKSHFPRYLEFMMSGPSVAMVFVGYDAIKLSRNLIGSTNPNEAIPGTIRGDYCNFIGENLIHGSDSKENADYEINLWFD